MKRTDYQRKIMEQVGADYKTTCEDCGAASQLSHAVINHDTNTVRMVCNNCFINKYKKILYPENMSK